ncbi:MAG: hypothetical protein PVF50_01490 [Gammaproteobacteria bacterium]
MQENNSPLDHLELVYEMNRLFLSFLQDRARRSFDCLGLPAPIAARLRSAGDAQLDRAAGVPHALFRLDLEPVSAADAPLEYASSEAIALYALQSSLLLSARNLCRQNPHLAQTFLSLPASTLIRLRCLALIEIATVARTARLCSAAFANELWLWHEVLDAESSGEQRRLRLIAMQPRVADLGLPARAAGRQMR